MNENAVLLVIFKSCSGAAFCVLVSARTDMVPLGRSLCGRGQGSLLPVFGFLFCFVFSSGSFLGLTGDFSIGTVRVGDLIHAKCEW